MQPWKLSRDWLGCAFDLQSMKMISIKWNNKSHKQIKLKENEELGHQPNSPIIRETNPSEADDRESGLGLSSFKFNTNVNTNPINWMTACNHKHIRIQKQK